MSLEALKSGTPRHEQVTEWLRGQIKTGAYEADERLPSEKELCDQFGISRITARRALQTLESEGLIYRRQGLGSFVRPPQMQQGLVRLTDFAQDVARAGLVAASRILHRAQEPVLPHIAGMLQMEAGAPVSRLDRLRLANGEPIALDRTWLPLWYAQLLEGHDLEHDTIYAILERDYRIPVLGGRYRIEAGAADATVAEALQVPVRTPLLVVDRISWTISKRPIYFQRRFYRSDRIAFELELIRAEGAESGEGMPLREFEQVFKLGRDPGTMEEPR